MSFQAGHFWKFKNLEVSKKILEVQGKQSKVGGCKNKWQYKH